MLDLARVVSTLLNEVELEIRFQQGKLHGVKETYERIRQEAERSQSIGNPEQAPGAQPNEKPVA